MHYVDPGGLHLVDEGLRHVLCGAINAAFYLHVRKVLAYEVGEAHGHGVSVGVLRRDDFFANNHGVDARPFNDKLSKD